MAESGGRSPPDHDAVVSHDRLNRGGFSSSPPRSPMASA